MNTSNLHILLAEDSPDDVLLMKRALQKCVVAHTLAVVEDGEETIQYLQGVGKYVDRHLYPFPTFCILDINMPRKTGMEVLEWLSRHEECSVIPTIVLSTSAVPSDLKKAYQLAANEFFTKPHDSAALCDMLGVIMKYWTLSHAPEPPVARKCR